MLIQILANRKFEHSDIDDAIAARGADHVTEPTQCRGCITSPAQTRDCGHARVIPTAHNALLYQLPEFTLTGDGVARVQPAEFVLPWPARHRQVIQQPIV